MLVFWLNFLSKPNKLLFEITKNIWNIKELSGPLSTFESNELNCCYSNELPTRGGISFEREIRSQVPYKFWDSSNFFACFSLGREILNSNLKTTDYILFVEKFISPRWWALTSYNSRNQLKMTNIFQVRLQKKKKIIVKNDLN